MISKAVISELSPPIYSYIWAVIVLISLLLKSYGLTKEVKVSKTAFLFPGQGSQTPGMATALAKESQVARDILAEIDTILSFNLSGLMAEGLLPSNQRD